MKLQRMAPPKGSRKRRKLLGRGESSGRGKTSGRGGKGQTARSGGRIRLGFEGGQMPLYRRLPKKGFTSRKRVLGINRYHVVNLSALEVLDAGTEVNADLLRAKGIVSSGTKHAGIKLLANGKLTKKLTITVDKASASAVKAVEALGGKVILPVEKAA